jgi:ankyrin repeat protein
MNKVITFLCLSGLTLGSALFAMEPASASSLALAGQDVTHIQQGEELRKAAQAGNLGLVQKFLGLHFPIDAKGTDGWTALMHAAAYGHKEVCQLLIDAKAPVDSKDNDGWTALMLAANNNRKDTCQLLIDAKAQVDAKDNNGWTALTVTAYFGHQAICQQLIDAMLKPIKQNRAAASLLLGMKKFNKAACMSQNDRNIIQLIAHQIYNPATIQQLFAQIDSIKRKNLKEDLRTYALEQLKLQMDPNTNQGTFHE